MKLSTKDRDTLQDLAQRYSEIAHLDVQKERIERYYRTNALPNGLQPYRTSSRRTRRAGR